MKTTVKITLFLNTNELKLICDTVQLLNNIDNLFNVDPEMRERIDIAMNSLEYIYNEASLEEENEDDD